MSEDWILNRYQIIEQLGEGGMGVVYRATDRLSEHHIALKRVQLRAFNYEQNKQLLKLHLTKEFQILASMRHPNIVRVRDFGFDESDTPFFTMDLIEDARDILSAAEMANEKTQIDMLIQLLQAMTYLHRNGLIHRDIKPTNILVNPWHEVKVVDFGLALESGHLVRVGGTAAYAAPEIIRHQALSPASDLFAIGILAYEIFTGTHPFGGFVDDCETRILNEEPDYSQIPERFSFSNPIAPSLRAIVQRLMAKDPALRYQNADSVAIELSAVIGEDIFQDNLVVRESFLQAAKFVGREYELGLFDDALMDLSFGRGSNYLIGGPSGIGKSRLADEVAARALVQGAQVIHLQCHEHRHDPYELWRDALPYLILRSEIHPEEASLLASILSNMERLTDQAVANLPSEPKKAEIEACILDIFRRQENPIVLIIEDLQWARKALDTLTQLLNLCNEIPLMIIGTYDEDPNSNLPAHLPISNKISLKRLNDEQIAALSVSMLGTLGKHPRVLEMLKHETEGNPYFVIELIRTLVEESGGLAAVGTKRIAIEGGLDRIFARRLQRVPPWAYTCLQVAAVMGRELDLKVIERLIMPILRLVDMKAAGLSSFATVYRSKSSVKLDDWLMICADAAILEVHEQFWRFRHEILREQALVPMQATSVKALEAQVQRAHKAVYGE